MNPVIGNNTEQATGNLLVSSLTMLSDNSNKPRIKNNRKVFQKKIKRNLPHHGRFCCKLKAWTAGNAGGRQVWCKVAPCMWLRDHARTTLIYTWLRSAIVGSCGQVRSSLVHAMAGCWWWWM